MNQYGPQYPSYSGYPPAPPPAERRAKAVALTVGALAAVAVLAAGIVVWIRSDSAPASDQSAGASTPRRPPTIICARWLTVTPRQHSRPARSLRRRSSTPPATSCGCSCSARFGDQPSSVTLTMVKPQGSADWQLPKVAITVAPLQPDWQNRIIKVLTVAGIPAVEAASTTVFPGAAPVFSTSPFLDVTAAPLLLEPLSSDAAATWSPRSDQ